MIGLGTGLVRSGPSLGKRAGAAFLGRRLATKALAVPESAYQARWLACLFGLDCLPLGFELFFDWALLMGLWPNKIGNSKNKIK